ncbi:MAG: shikimate kinase [Desulforhopalus sp.]
MPKNIILIGFMGVGKGRTARELSQLTGRLMVDTDNIIESFTKKKIRVIFADQGEAAFRAMERQTANWLQHHVTNTIVATGGGFFMVKNIRKLGRIIYLHSSVEGIIATIHNHPNAAKKIKKRPLLQNLNAARELYSRRLPLYRKAADHEINVEGKDIRAVAEEIARISHEHFVEIG